MSCNKCGMLRLYIIELENFIKDHSAWDAAFKDWYEAKRKQQVKDAKTNLTAMDPP